jgi:hypothetical protein
MEGIAWHETWHLGLRRCLPSWHEGIWGDLSGRARPRGNIEQLASGAFRVRVRVYAGTDVLTGERLYLRTTIPAGPDALEQAETDGADLVRERLAQRTNALLRRLLAEHLALADVGSCARPWPITLPTRRQRRPSSLVWGGGDDGIVSFSPIVNIETARTELGHMQLCEPGFSC